MRKKIAQETCANLNRDTPNLEATLERVSIEAIETAGFVQSSFAAFNSLLSLSPETFHLHRLFTFTIPTRRSCRAARCAKRCAVTMVRPEVLEGRLRSDPERRILECARTQAGIATAPTS